MKADRQNRFEKKNAKTVKLLTQQENMHAEKQVWMTLKEYESTREENWKSSGEPWLQRNHFWSVNFVFQCYFLCSPFLKKGNGACLCSVPAIFLPVLVLCSRLLFLFLLEAPLSRASYKIHDDVGVKKRDWLVPGIWWMSQGWPHHFVSRYRVRTTFVFFLPWKSYHEHLIRAQFWMWIIFFSCVICTSAKMTCEL